MAKFYQNQNKYTVTVPTAEGVGLTIDPGQFVIDNTSTYYAHIGALTEVLVGVVVAADTVYTYDPVFYARIDNQTGAVENMSGVDVTSGFSGYSGRSGYSGYSGTSGFSGYSGTSGFSGYSGTSGFSGSSGTSGYSGTSGARGAVGTSGYSGTVYVTTGSKTAASAGVLGEFAYGTSGFFVNVDGASGWAFVGSIPVV